MRCSTSKIIQEFYKRPDVRKKKIRLEKKLSEAREELDIISDIAGEIMLVPDKYGSLYLYFYNDVYKITVCLGKEIKVGILHIFNRSGMLGEERKDLKTNLKWVIKMLTEKC